MKCRAGAANVIVCFIALFLSTIVEADDRKHVYRVAKSGYVNLNPFLQVLEDPGGSLTISDVSSRQYSDKFKSSSEAIHGYGFTKSVYWFRFTVDYSNYKKAYSYVLQKYEHISDLRLYYPTSSGKYKAVKTGTSVPTVSRQYRLRNFLFKVPASGQSQVTYYVRADSQGKWLLIDLDWASDAGLIERVSTTSLVFGLFFGGLGVMFVYNLFLFASLRDRTYLYYTYYVLCFICMFFFINGFALRYIGYDAKYSSMWTVFMHASINSVILTVRSFFELKRTVPFLDKVLKLFQYFSFASGVAALIFLSEGVSVQLAVYLTIGATPFLFVAGLLRWNQGLNAALYYLAGWSVFSLACLIYVLQTLTLLPTNVYTTYGIQFGALWESVLFALALAKRTKDLKEARDRAVIETRENRKLNEKVTSVLENERKLISQDIHDNINANILAVKMSSQRILSLSKGNGSQLPEINKLASSISSIAKESYESARSLVRALRPENIDTLGLTGALEELVENHNLASGKCEYICSIEGVFEDIAEECAIACYRIAQEAISNTIKYANATIVRISLLRDGDAMKLSIKDNGKGFDPQKLESEGVGLISMRERSISVGGKFNIASDNRGTGIEVLLPTNTDKVTRDDGLAV